MNDRSTRAPPQVARVPFEVAVTLERPTLGEVQTKLKAAAPGRFSAGAQRERTESEPFTPLPVPAGPKPRFGNHCKTNGALIPFKVGTRHVESHAGVNSGGPESTGPQPR